MKIETYGANKIGGCITEVSQGNTKIIFDYGDNLDDTEQIDIEGLTIGNPKYDAVFISHYHLDHIGAINKIKKEIPIYIEKTTKKLYDIICDFKNKPRINAITFNFEENINIGNLTVKPYKVDHSAYNSAMFVITDGKEKAIYTGDFRNNGYTGHNLLPTFEKIGKVYYLITEGTNIGDNSHIIKKEESLVEDLKKVMDEYDQVFVLMSSSNIDRITSLLKVANKTKHIMIQDIYMAHLTSTIYKEDKICIPNPIKHKDIMVYKPQYLLKKKNTELQNKYLNCFNEQNNSKMLYTPFTMNVRTSMIDDLEMFKTKNILTKACLVYSMWGGYKQKEDIKKFIEKVKELGIKPIKKEIHTTGHASEEVIERVKEITQPEKVYIIHTNMNGE